MSSKNGKAPRKIKVAEQVAVIHSLGQAAAALLVGVTPRTLRETPAAPRGADGLYDGPQLVRYFRERDLARQSSKRIVSGDDQLMADESDSPALEKYREHRATLAGFQVDETRGNLIPRAEVRMTLLWMAQLLQRAGERLEVACGQAAQDIHNETLREFAREIGIDPESLNEKPNE